MKECESLATVFLLGKNWIEDLHHIKKIYSSAAHQ